MMIIDYGRNTEPNRQSNWQIGSPFPRQLEDETYITVTVDGRELRAIISLIRNMSGDTPNSKLSYNRRGKSYAR